jgi:mitochondrial splicing suppressor protein 51
LDRSSHNNVSRLYRVFESYLLIFSTQRAQPYCTTCYRSALQIVPPAILRPCPVCHLVFTCDTCTLPPSHECELYQQIGNIERFRINQFGETSKALCEAPTGTPRSSFRALATAKNWREYFTEISDKKHSVGNFINSDFNLDEMILQAVPDLEIQRVMRRVRLFLVLARETLTMPLTILAALEDSINDLSARKTISIHLIGAAAREFGILVLFEEILHLVPSLQTLKIVLIGPNAGPSTEQTEQHISLDCCPPCSSRSKKRITAFYRGLYHDYVKEAHYQKPDLAVLFHSGRSQEEQESWRPTTELLVESGTLTLCTTFTHREV